MSTSTTTRPFHPASGTDWAPHVTELTSVLVELGEADEFVENPGAAREHLLTTLRRIHADGFVGFCVQLHTELDRLHLSVGATAVSSWGGSLDIAWDAATILAGAWGRQTTATTWNWFESDRLTQTAYRFRRAPQLGVDWANGQWDWRRAVHTMSTTTPPTCLRLSFLATTDIDPNSDAALDLDLPLPRLWTADLTLSTPEELTATATGRLSELLAGSPAWQTVEKLQRDDEIGAVGLGIPIAGGARRRHPGQTITIATIADLLGFNSVHPRDGRDVF